MRRLVHVLPLLIEGLRDRVIWLKRQHPIRERLIVPAAIHLLDVQPPLWFRYRGHRKNRLDQLRARTMAMRLEPIEMTPDSAGLFLKVDTSHTRRGSGNEVGKANIVLFAVAPERFGRAIPAFDVHFDRFLPLAKVVLRPCGIVDVHPSVDCSREDDIERPAQTSLHLFQPVERLADWEKSASVRGLQQDEDFPLLRFDPIKIVHNGEVEADVFVKLCRSQAIKPLIQRAAEEEGGIPVMSLPQLGRAQTKLNQACGQCHGRIFALRMRKRRGNVCDRRQKEARCLPGQRQCSQGSKGAGVGSRICPLGYVAPLTKARMRDAVCASSHWRNLSIVCSWGVRSCRRRR